MANSFREQYKANREGGIPDLYAKIAAMSDSTLEDVLKAVEDQGIDFDPAIIRVSTVHQRQDVAVISMLTMLSYQQLNSIRRWVMVAALALVGIAVALFSR